MEPMSYESACKLLENIMWKWRCDARYNSIEFKNLKMFMEMSDNELRTLLEKTKFTDERKRK